MDAETMQKLNYAKGPHQILKYLNGTIVGTNTIAAVISFVVLVLRLIGYSVPLPSPMDSYSLGLLSIVNAAFLVQQSIAYDRYYDRFTKASEVKTTEGLLDVSIKLLLLAGTFVLMVFPLWLVPLVAVTYLLSNARLRLLRRSLNSEHPFSKDLEQTMLPNNTWHLRAIMLLLVLWVIIHFGFVPCISEILLSSPGIFDEKESNAITMSSTAFYCLIFALYWSVRMASKRIRIPNPMLKVTAMNTRDQEISDFLDENQSEK